MLFAWFAKKSLGLVNWGWLVIGAVVLVAWLWLGAAEKADDAANRQIGAATQREGDLKRTIERTEQANDAREEIEEGFRRPAGDVAVYHQCLRTARTPANCQRFVPDIAPDIR
jgi:hypothetical protein